jgi:dihydroorotase
VDVIASGHDPRGPEDKRLPFADAEPGMAGAETLLPLVLNLVREELIDTAAAFRLLAANPAQLLDVNSGVIEPGREADVAVIDPDAPWLVDRRMMEATADNTPFDRQGVQGRVKALIKGGVEIPL